MRTIARIGVTFLWIAVLFLGGWLVYDHFSASKEHAIVEDDFEAALALARSENKRLLINFTGHT